MSVDLRVVERVRPGEPAWANVAPFYNEATLDDVLAWLSEHGITDEMVERASIAYEDQYDEMDENGFNARAILVAALNPGDTRP